MSSVNSDFTSGNSLSEQFSEFTKVWLKRCGREFIAEHEAEYLAGNEFQMLQRLRNYLTKISVVKLDQSGIADLAHELLLEFKRSNEEIISK